MNKIPVTLWYAWNEKQKDFEMNHLEDGHSLLANPKPKSPEFESQKSWNKGKWKKKLTYLENGKVIDE